MWVFSPPTHGSRRSPTAALLQIGYPALSGNILPIESLKERQIVSRLSHYAYVVYKAQQIPVCRLIYPSGFEHQLAVPEAILKDLEMGKV